MKKVFPLLLTLTVFSGFFIFWRLAPSEKDITPSLSIAEASIFMDLNSERTLTFETTLDQDELRWYSSDPALLTVKDGNLTALKAGQVTVWVTTEDASLYDSVTIEIEEAILLSLPLPIQPEVPIHPVEPEAPVEPELEVTAEPEPEPEVPGDPVDTETEVPVEPEPEEVVTPSTIYTITITNETGAVITTLEVEEGSFITTSSLELPELFKGFYLEGEICEDDPFDLETPITEDLTLIEASFNDEAPCLQLDYIVLSGRPVAGTTLTVDIFPLGANVTISWYISVNNRTYREIQGESGSTFTVRPEDSGKFIRVYVVSDSNPPVVRYDTAKLDVFKTVESETNTIIPLTQEEQASATAIIAVGSIPIAYPEDLLAINQDLDASYVLIRDIDLLGYKDLTQSFINGTFTGSLDGKGFTISHLTINAPNSDEIGLFSFISGASITNLNLSTFNITGHNKVGSLAGESNNAAFNQIQTEQITVSGLLFVGGMIGTAVSTAITDIMMTDTSVFGSGDAVGGMLGRAISSTLSNSIMTHTDVSGYLYVGGMIGFSADQTLITNSEMTHTSVYVIGDVVGGLIGMALSTTITGVKMTDTSVLGSASAVGGMTGYAASTSIANVVMMDTYVLGSGSGIGGMMGYASSTFITQITMTNTSVLGSGVSGIAIGGLVGNLVDTSTLSNTTMTKTTVSGKERVGGLIGDAGNITLTHSLLMNTTVSAVFSVGGLVGWATSITILKSAILNSSVSGTMNIGGLIGLTDTASLIEDSYSLATISGDDFVGGMVGYFKSGTHHIVDSYVATQINGSGSFRGGAVGFINENTNVIFTDIFWNSDLASGMDAFGNVHQDATFSGTITAITTSQMQDEDTFTNGDFMSAWVMYAQLNEGFPYLFWTESFMIDLFVNPFQSSIPIATPEDFLAINSSVLHIFPGQLATEGGLHKSYFLIKDLDFSSYTNLTQSFINGTFTGNLSGQGFTLFDLTINAFNTNYVGLFSFIAGASISDLTLNTFDITGTNYIGALAGSVQGSTFSTLKMINTTVVGNDRVGGLAGFAADTIISDSVMTNTAIKGTIMIGGIVGEGLTLTISNSTLSNTTMTGIGSANRIGGLVGTGKNLTLTENTLTQTNVAGVNRLGGLVGAVPTSEITVISNTVMIDTTVIGSGHDNGGLVGLITAIASITQTTLSSITVIGRDHIGGLIGRTGIDEVTISGAWIDGSLSGSSQTGGIVGLINNTATITNASFTGTRNGQAYSITYP